MYHAPVEAVLVSAGAQEDCLRAGTRCGYTKPTAFGLEVLFFVFNTYHTAGVKKLRNVAL